MCLNFDKNLSKFLSEQGTLLRSHSSSYGTDNPTGLLRLFYLRDDDGTCRPNHKKCKKYQNLILDIPEGRCFNREGGQATEGERRS